MDQKEKIVCLFLSQLLVVSQIIIKDIYLFLLIFEVLRLILNVLFFISFLVKFYFRTITELEHAVKKDSDKAESVLLGPEPLALMVQSLNNLQMPPQMFSPLETVTPDEKKKEIVTVSIIIKKSNYFSGR